MRPGLDEDDRWVMVEDEFLTTAKLFTTQLHHAEYQRLRKLSRARGASTLSTISRATVGRTEQDTLNKKIVEANALRKRTKTAVRNIVGSGDDDDDDDLVADPYMDDPTLAGLMNNSQESVRLGKLVRSPDKVKSRPGRDTKRHDQLHNNTDTGDDDLDSVPNPALKRRSKPIPTPRALESSRSKTSTRFTRQTREDDRVVSLDRNVSKSSIIRSTTEVEQRSTSLPEPAPRSPEPSSVDEYGSLSRRSKLPPKLLARMNERKAANTKLAKDTEEKEKKKSASRISDVPVFLL
jgi:hypothetical protein